MSIDTAETAPEMMTRSTGKVSAKTMNPRTGRWLGRGLIVAWAAMIAALALALVATPAMAADEFGIVPGSFTATPASDQAGAHDDATTSFTFNADPDTGVPIETVKDIVVDLPPGAVGNAESFPKCTAGQLVTMPLPACPANSQVGEVHLHFLNFGFNFETIFPVYNMEPRGTHTAELGFNVLLASIFVSVSVRPEDHGLRATISNIPTTLRLGTSTMTLWGDPADPSHDERRGSTSCSIFGGVPYCSNPPTSATFAPRPFMRNPTECGEPGVATLKVRSWDRPDREVTDYADPTTMVGCDRLNFDPDLTLQPSSKAAGQPTGITVDLTVPQSDNPTDLGSADLKKAVVKLPAGLTVNPASTDGQRGCSLSEIGLAKTDDPTCPQESKIGTVQIDTPLLGDPMTGAVYLARPYDNPFDSLLAMYIVAQGSGVTIKLPGLIESDPVTGQLTTTFDDNPQLPFTRLRLRLKGGSRAPLKAPDRCGTFTTDSALTSWSGATVTASSSMTIDQGCAGLGGFDPRFAAGVADPAAGASSAFSLLVSRRDGEQELKGLSQIRLPEGLLADVGSVPLCGDAQAASGSCAEESRVGRVQLATGAGTTPLWVPEAGKEQTGVYLTGPYKGAPYGLSIKVPAQAGPFDLGTVVVRSALRVDERTTAITTGIDESRLIDPNGTVTQVLPGDLPRILKGIVLGQREIRVTMDRKGFMVNPTDCSQQQISAQVHGYGGGRAEVANRFRAVECANLGFAPRFSARILDRGRKSTLRSFHPRTRFTVVPRKGDANIGGARVVLPSSTLLDQANIGTTCTRAQMAERKCPEASIVGYARAWSPLLAKAVEGPVYLAANGGVRPLPDLAAVLDGEIRVVLQGEIATRRGGGKARLQNTFRVVPDAPVSRFVLTMRGGDKRGLLVNSTDLCRSKERGTAVFQGQNGRVHRLRPRIATSFRGCGKVRRQAARRKAAR